jgi:hypothetical protein
MNRYHVAAMALFAFLPAHAAAEQGLASAILACAAQPDEKAQLACYNGIAAQLKAAQGSSTSVPVATTPPAQQTAQTPKPEGGSWYNPSAWFGSNAPAQTNQQTNASRAGNPADFGSESLPEKQTGGPAQIDSMTAKVTSVSYNYFRRFTVTLDNGQVWRQNESDTREARFSDDGGETVTVKRGILGFGLVIAGRPVSYSVKRIK